MTLSQGFFSLVKILFFLLDKNKKTCVKFFPRSFGKKLFFKKSGKSAAIDARERSKRNKIFLLTIRLLYIKYLNA